MTRFGSRLGFDTHQCLESGTQVLRIHGQSPLGSKIEKYFAQRWSSMPDRNGVDHSYDEWRDFRRYKSCLKRIGK